MVQPAPARTSRGFFNEYLMLGPYSGGDRLSQTVQALDFLCDGATNEDNIRPREGLEIGRPDAGRCAVSGVAFLGASTRPRVGKALTSGDVLNLNTLYAPSNDNVMSYAWVYVYNRANETKVFNLALASDDGIHVAVNRTQVLNVNDSRPYGDPGFIQNRVPVTLLPGENLIRFKCFENTGEWGFRARLETAGGAAVTDLDGLGQIVIRVIPDDTPSPLGSATRAVFSTLDGETVTVDVTVTIDVHGEPYSLVESFARGWVVSEITSGGAGGDSVTWQDITDGTLRYRLTRSDAYFAPAEEILGLLTVKDTVLQVTGAQRTGYSVKPYIEEVLLTPSFEMSGADGCSVTAEGIEGNWIRDCAGLTDGNIMPFEGMQFRPSFGTGSQAAGLDPELGPASQAKFWSLPGRPATAKAVLAKVLSTSEGFYDWQRSDIFQADLNNSMCIAFFYVVNDTGQEPLVLATGLGSDDSSGVRLNGRQVATVRGCGGPACFDGTLEVSLKKGKNLFAFYTFERSGEYNACLRFQDSNRNPFPVRTTLDPTGYFADDPTDPGDCNNNCVPDSSDIATGNSMDDNANGIPDECEPLSFVRGDCNGDGDVTGSVTDAVFLLRYLFLGGSPPRCQAACDANGDGQVRGVVTDAIYILSFNFLGGPAPPAPFPDCGPGGERDQALGCALPPNDCAAGR